MFFKKKFTKKITPSFISPTSVDFGKDIKFTLTPECLSADSYLFHLGNLKSDLDIIKISYDCFNIFNDKIKGDLSYDKEKKTFKFRNYLYYHALTFKFRVLANVEYKKVCYVEDTYVLHFPSKSLKMLDLFEYEEIEITLPKYPYVHFNCYFKKHEKGAVEIHIVNPHDVKIQGKKGDFIYETNDSKDVDLRLSFVFDPSANFLDCERFEAIDSRPESAFR
uniref:Uncharacterized protein n=1 Tax=Panagrolaimus davidi TaxID=227884 RepID=A0A914P6I8_9BILA